VLSDQQQLADCCGRLAPKIMQQEVQASNKKLAVQLGENSSPKMTQRNSKQPQMKCWSRLPDSECFRIQKIISPQETGQVGLKYLNPTRRNGRIQAGRHTQRRGSDLGDKGSGGGHE
jgi:hypothetical protein